MSSDPNYTARSAALISLRNAAVLGLLGGIVAKLFVPGVSWLSAIDTALYAFAGYLAGEKLREHVSAIKRRRNA